MNRQFMEKYYWETYNENIVDMVISKKEEYLKLRDDFFKSGNKVLETLASLGEEYSQYHEEWYLAICALESFIAKEMYLLGAQDRDKMIQ